MRPTGWSSPRTGAPRDWWRLQASYSYLGSELRPKSPGTDLLTIRVKEGSSPRHQLSLRSSMDLGSGWELDFWVYHVDRLPAVGATGELSVDAYTSLNARLGWRPTRDLELSLVGRNLNDAHHLEFAGASYLAPTEVDRSVYLQLRWEL